MTNMEKAKAALEAIKYVRCGLPNGYGRDKFNLAMAEEFLHSVLDDTVAILQKKEDGYHLKTDGDDELTRRTEILDRIEEIIYMN